MRNSSIDASASLMVAGDFNGVSTRVKAPFDPAAAAAAHMFSNTVREGKICATWNEREMPRRVISREGQPVMSRSSSLMVPLVGRRWPVIMLMNVVLPAPLVPISPTTESFSIAALTSFAAVTAPKLLQSPRASRTVGMAASKQ